MEKCSLTVGKGALFLLEKQVKERSSLWVLDGHDDGLLEQPLGLLQPRHVLPPDVRMPDHNVLRDQGRHLLDLDAAKVGGRPQRMPVALPIGVLKKSGNASGESGKPDANCESFLSQVLANTAPVWDKAVQRRCQKGGPRSLWDGEPLESWWWSEASDLGPLRFWGSPSITDSRLLDKELWRVLGPCAQFGGQHHASCCRADYAGGFQGF
jgi:hypothetical protein